MAILAKQRYGLDLVDGSLPNCTVGQSLDVVKVICSLGDFVTDFNYCLNQQVLLQYCLIRAVPRTDSFPGVY
ncbi:hypothetical protein OESDEN_18744 [Oesophagostomum dentatum]|uniref:WASH complex subunit 7 central domain-containing protein n=1 Tax=Oesophagostomum dentatum TaxID=61180 RepID=A0A0B1S9G9_OESDE|nr:hypothetical protein OESDEN_18744 [Oesophagostomum dentatum]